MKVYLKSKIMNCLNITAIESSLLYTPIIGEKSFGNYYCNISYDLKVITRATMYVISIQRNW